MKKILFILLLTFSKSLCTADNWNQVMDLVIELDSKQEYDKAIALALPFADSGDSDILNIIGCLYLDKKDIPTSRVWFERAIQKGNVAAMFNLGLTYDGINTRISMFEGSWISREFLDFNKAKYYYKMAFEYPDYTGKSKYDAVMNYASILFNEDKQEDAVKLLLSQLRETEYGALRRQLGGMYEKMGRPTDAFRMYRIGAEYGDMRAMYSLGVAYMNPSSIKGLDIQTDKKAAIEWFTKIAEINDPNFNDSFGSKTGRALRYLNALYADLYYETYDETYLNQSLRWGSRYIGDIFVDDVMYKIYQEGLADSKKFSTYDDWIVHLTEKYAVDSDIDIDVPISKTNRNDTYALIIANEEYEYEAMVPFASRDGNIFFKYMNQALGIPKENMKLLTNVSLNKFKYELSWFKDMLETHPNSNAIIYYAGHGVPDENGSTSYLLPVDGFAKNISSGLDINDVLSETAANSTRTLVILDACFSGLKRDGKMITSARGVAIKQPEPTLQNKTVVLTACSGAETAYAYNDQQHGLFTYYLLKILKESSGKISLGKLTDDIIAHVKKASMDINNKIQSPSITVSDDIYSNWRNLYF